MIMFSTMRDLSSFLTPVYLDWKTETESGETRETAVVQLASCYCSFESCAETIFLCNLILFFTFSTEACTY